MAPLPGAVPPHVWYPFVEADPVARMRRIGREFNASLNLFASAWLHFDQRLWYGYNRFCR
jgi:hypothetical protein